MDAHDEWPRLGPAPIDPTSLGEEGVELGVLLAELGAEIDDPSVVAPERGWRVLRVPDSRDVVVIAAPVDDDRRAWQIAQLTPARDGDAPGVRRARMHPDAQTLRASRADRRRGLRLRWPGAAYDGDIDRVVIDVVNDGDEPWRPEDEVAHGWLKGDVFHAVGELHLPGGEPSGRSLEIVTVGGMARALPLDPGDYARIPVKVNAVQWSELEPGRYELDVFLVGLGVHTDAPLEVMVTEEHIERHRSRLGTQHRASGNRREELRERLEISRALAASQERVAAILDVVLAAPSHDAARAGIQELLDCSTVAAGTVLEQSLLRFSAESREAMNLEVAHLERMLDETPEDGASE